MVCDHPVARLDVGSLKHDLDVFEWHIQVTEAADDLSRDDLLRGVASVSGVPIYIHRLQETNLVVMAKHLDAQVRGPREVADGERCGHHPSLESPPVGESRSESALDSPIAGGLKLDLNGPPGRSEEPKGAI